MRRFLAVMVAATSVLVLFAGSARAAAGFVHIVNGAPNPSSLTVDNGDTVTIFNDDDVAHAIFANGVQQGPSIAPHTGGEYGPFNTGGTAARFDYRVDSDGPAGVIHVRAGSATTTTLRPSTTTTTRPRTTTTTTTTVATTTTSTTIATTTTSATTTTTVAVRSSESGSGKDSGSSPLGVLGIILVLVGLGGLVLVMTMSRRRRGRQP